MSQSLVVQNLVDQLEKFEFSVACVGDCTRTDRPIHVADLHRPGLALVGHFFHHHPERIQVFGETEITFLASQDVDTRTGILNAMAATEVPCFVVTRGLTIDHIPELNNAAIANGVPILTTEMDTGHFIRTCGRLLSDLMAPSTVMHGVMIDVFGVGVLITGPSGIGKSECALELVLKGHRLVADDMVEITLKQRTGLICQGMQLIKHHMEIRGLGIINVQDLFGVAAVRDQKRLELIVHLEHWDPETYYDRIGTENDNTKEILGVEVSTLNVPVRPGRTLSEIIEVAARNRLLKIRGVDSAKRFQEKLMAQITAATPNEPRPLEVSLEDDPD